MKRYKLCVAIADDLVKIDQEWYVVLLDPDDTGTNDEWNGNYILRKVGLIPAGNGNWRIGMLCGKSNLKVISMDAAELLELDAYVDMCCTLSGTPLLGNYVDQSTHFRDDMMFKAGGRKVIL